MLLPQTLKVENIDRMRASENRPSEHPRSATSDDVECFFSVMRDLIGKEFSMKQVKVGFQKSCWSFASGFILTLNSIITHLLTHDFMKVLYPVLTNQRNSRKKAQSSST